MYITMTRDRTDQLRAEMAKESKSYNRYKFWAKDDKMEEDNSEQEALTGVVVQPVISKAGKKEQEILNSIFKEVQQIKEWIGTMKEDVGVLKNCQVLVQRSTRSNPGMKDKIQDLMAKIKSTTTKIRTNLQVLEKRKEDTDSAINKVVNTQQCLLKKAFTDVVEEYQESLILHRKICEDILKKQLVIADRDVSQEELGAILEADDIAVFVDNYMQNMLEAKMKLQVAEDLHKEITHLEKEIKLLNELFTDLSLHITRQGEIIDRIEYHIVDGSEKTKKATKKLGKAHKMMVKIRKGKFWIIAFIVIFILLLIVFILA